ncbi:AI-2E family transporter [Microcella sp.]|uniref:AI-2E family transporter n=1 Tax=Microcella sp. TaxID=1913979 RepID=UPI00299F8621|nr:AI-2E family transporter [Microcella sp.]MDX2025640.1 AI-2E family transporter [Microcella sp.]
MFWRPKADVPAAAGDDAVAPAMRTAAAWSWRLLVVAGLVGVLIFLIIQLRLIVIPLLIAVLLAALLIPYAAWLKSRLRFPHWLAVAAALLTLVTVLTALIWLVVAQVRAGWPSLQDRSVDAFDEFLVWLSTTFGLSTAEITAWIDGIVAELDFSTQGPLVTGALSVSTTALELLAGTVLVIFSLLFFLIDGPNIWRFVVRLFPRTARTAVDGAARAGWLTLTNFSKVQIFVAFVDGLGIGLIAWVLGLPLALPIGVAVFLASFVPFIGALVTGSLAVLIALVYNGPVVALLMLGGVLLVQQLEGNVLQPLVMGPAVRVHPLAVVLAVTTGGLLAGIPGTLFAVPIAAFSNVFIRYIASGRWRVIPHPMTLSDIQPPPAPPSQERS